MKRRHALLLAAATTASALALAARIHLTNRNAPAQAAFSPKGEMTWLSVPHVRGDITLDGDMDDSGWLAGCARTESFVGEDGKEAHPYSDIRLVWDSQFLYVALYAADQDIHARESERDGKVWLDDSFHFVLETGANEYSFDVSATGVLTDGRRAKSGAESSFDFGWNSDAHVSCEADGTINVAGDYDEEWVTEMAIPLEPLTLRGEPGERVGFSARRCDTAAETGERSCGSWGRGAARGGLVFARSSGEQQAQAAR